MNQNNNANTMEKAKTTFADEVWQRGALVTVSMGSWSMQAKLKAEDLNLKDVKHELIKLGHKRLFSKEQSNIFSRMRTRVQQLLKRNGYGFILRGSYYVPFTILEDSLETLAEYQKEYNELADKFTENYDVFRDSWLERHSEYRDVLESYYPEPAEVRNKYYFRFWVHRVTDSMADTEYAVGAALNENDYEDFVRSSVNQLRGEITTKISKIQETLENDGVNKRMYNSIRKIRDNFMEINLITDEALDDALVSLEQNLNLETVSNVLKNSRPLGSKQIRKMYF